MFVSDEPKHETPFWRALLLIALPIMVTESCRLVREHMRRSHEARIRREEHAAGIRPRKDDDDDDE